MSEQQAAGTIPDKRQGYHPVPAFSYPDSKQAPPLSLPPGLVHLGKNGRSI